MSKSRKEEIDDELAAEEEGFIATNRYRTKLCGSLEDALQECVLKKRGLYGCETFMDQYSKCKARESRMELDTLRRQSEDEVLRDSKSVSGK